MSEPPRHRDEPVLPLSRVLRTAAFGVTMMVGTLAVLYYAMRTGSEARALTMAFTTFVLFQPFNVFNARNERGSAFNSCFFNNRMLWLIGRIGKAALASRSHAAGGQDAGAGRACGGRGPADRVHMEGTAR